MLLPIEEHFNDDLICRTDIPRDAFDLIHDICYHMDKIPVSHYINRARRILKSTNYATQPADGEKPSHQL